MNSWDSDCFDGLLALVVMVFLAVACVIGSIALAMSGDIVGAILLPATAGFGIVLIYRATNMI